MNWKEPTLQDRLEALLHGLRLPSFDDMQKNPELSPAETLRTLAQHSKTMRKTYAAQCLARVMLTYGECLDGVQILAAQGNTWSLKECINLQWKEGTPARTIVAGENAMGAMRKNLGASRNVAEDVLPMGGRNALVHSHEAIAFMAALGVDRDLVAALKSHQLEQALPEARTGGHKPRM